MEKSILKVKMLGNFLLEYEGRSFAIERNTSTKVNQLLQLLLYYPEGIARTQLMNYMFENEDITNPSNSLRALVFRLRKSLKANGLPDDDYVKTSKGLYSWTDNIKIECDAHKFEEIATAARNEKAPMQRKELLLEACDIYGGDFLPMLIGVEWAVGIEVRLKKLYNLCVEELCETCIKDRDFENLRAVAEKARTLYPYNEWQGYEMQALIELGLKKEALKLYEETETLMFEELGVSVSARMSKQLDRLGNQIRNSTDMISTVKKNLEEAKEDGEGAFFCTYPVFTESYRYIKRVISRTGQSAWLMLCTLTDGKGYALDTGNRLEELASELADAISCSVRGGDMFTRYSDNQFLILLLGITKEDCAIVQSRINSNMEKESRKRYLQYHLAPVNTSGKKGIEDDLELKQIVWGME